MRVSAYCQLFFRQFLDSVPFFFHVFQLVYLLYFLGILFFVRNSLVFIITVLFTFVLGVVVTGYGIFFFLLDCFLCKNLFLSLFQFGFHLSFKFLVEFFLLLQSVLNCKELVVQIWVLLKWAHHYSFYHSLVAFNFKLLIVRVTKSSPHISLHFAHKLFAFFRFETFLLVISSRICF